MSTKVRLRASVDSELLAAGEAATRRGDVSSLSMWVNDALRLKLEHERRLGAMARFIEEFEREHGVISDDEIERARRRARARAVPVRSLRKEGTRPVRPRRSAP